MVHEFENVILPFADQDPDFGELVCVLNAVDCGARFGDFVVSPMQIGIYKDVDGYTAWADAFPLHFGYGASPEEAIQSSATYIAYSRRLYDNMLDDDGTREARLLRDKLCAYLTHCDQP